MKARGLAGALLAWATSLHASHPLITEDTEVVGKGTAQVEVHGTRSKDRRDGETARISEAGVVLSHGVTERAELQLELPYERESAGGEVTEGRGDASLSVKWRFHEGGQTSLVLKPEAHLPTGREEKGLGAGKVRWGASLVAGRELGRWQVLGHAGYLRNRNEIGERRSLYHLSAALLYAATDKLTLALDVSRDTNPERDGAGSLRQAVVGAMYVLRENLDLGLGVKRGLNEAADDRGVLLGLKARW